MTLAELRTLNAPALWAALPAERQAAIGAAALAVQFAGLVAGDDGSETTASDRNAALDLEGDALASLSCAAEAAFPGVQWWAP